MKVNIQRWQLLYYFSLILIAMFMINVSFANPPNRVARISYIDSVVSFLPAGEKRWVKAKLNRPLVLGDSLWTDLDSKAELQLGWSVLRQGPQTYIKILNLNNKIAQFKLSQGTLILNIRRVIPQQFYEIDTPNLALVIRQPGYYRIDVKKQLTTVTVRKGGAIIYGQKTAYKLNLGRICKFGGVNLQHFQCVVIGPPDSFDAWSLARDERFKKVTNTYVSQAMIGYEDLNYHGKWIVTKKYGRVWTPNRVSANWAPYRVGQWTWVRSWGWTWVDDQPWGFAPFHYGRWAFVERRWLWVPGPANVEPLYAPALVAFVGGRNYQLNLSAGRRGIAWFPLAPGEVYVPPYRVSRSYFNQLNLGNTYVNQNSLTTIYNNPNTVINYQNININNAVTAVPIQAFASSTPVNQAIVDVPTKDIIEAPKTPIAAIAPEPVSLLGGANEKTVQPAASLETTPAVAITPPPAPAIPFAEEQKLLNIAPGKPLPVEEIQTLQPTKEVKQPDSNEIKVINPEAEPKLINDGNIKPNESVNSQPEESGEIKQPDALPSTTIPPADVTNQPTGAQPETIPAPTSNDKAVPEPEVTQPEIAPVENIQQPNNVEPQEVIQEPVTSPEEQTTTQPEVIQQPEIIDPGPSQANPTTSEEPTVQPEQVTQPPIDETTTAPAETGVNPDADAAQPATVVEEPQEVLNQPGTEEIAPAGVPVEPQQMAPQEEMIQPSTVQPGTTIEPGAPQEVITTP